MASTAWLDAENEPPSSLHTHYPFIPLLTSFLRRPSALLQTLLFQSSLSSPRPAPAPGCLDGQTILITGANTGIGLESALQLATLGPAHIYLTSRSRSKGEAALETIRDAVARPPVLTLLELDLTSFASIRACARAFLALEDRLDVLVHNAGVMALPVAATRDGCEVQMGTNYVGPFLLTQLLLPALLKTTGLPDTDVRIVHLSSEAHHMSPPLAAVLLSRPSPPLDALSTWSRYGASKRAQILHVQQLARRYPSLTSVAVHPGVIETGLYDPQREGNRLLRWGMRGLGWAVLRGPKQGAWNSVWAVTAAKATAKEEKGRVRNGGYYLPVGWEGKVPVARREGEMLWAWTEAMVDGWLEMEEKEVSGHGVPPKEDSNEA